MAHAIEGLRHYLYPRPGLALVCVTVATLVGASVLERLLGRLAALWREPRTTLSETDQSNEALAEFACGLAMRLAHLAHEAERRFPAAGGTHYLEPSEGDEEAGEWLSDRYASHFMEEVAALRVEFMKRGLDDPGMEAYWHIPSTSEEVAQVALALERLAWTLRAMP